MNYWRSIGKLSIIAILSLQVLLLNGCATSKQKSASDLPPLFHFMAPASTNTVVVPANCKYGVWTTDTGLKALQGEF